MECNQIISHMTTTTSHHSLNGFTGLFDIRDSGFGSGYGSEGGGSGGRCCFGGAGGRCVVHVFAGFAALSPLLGCARFRTSE